MIFGHEKQWNFLIKTFKKGKIPHALLFSGLEKLGKRKLAIEFARFILKKEPFSHPDFIFVEPKDGIISISQIRDLIWRLSLKTFSAPFKIAIIDKAHSMLPDSQNCFLKTLEEPKNSLIILITEYPNLLFPTIASRCQQIKFFPVGIEKIKNFLIENGIERDRAEKIAKISEGRPGLAIDFLDQKCLDQWEGQRKDFERIINLPLYLRFEYAKNLAEEEKIEDFFKNWLSFLRKSFLKKIKEGLLLKELKEKIYLLEKINFLIKTKKINKRLALEIFMLEF